jgi:ribonuclease HI
MYTIQTDRVTGIIQVSVEGFWTVEEVGAFAGDLGREAAMLATVGRSPAIFYDYTNAVIQSQEVVAALQEVARRAPAGAQKVAIFTDGKLARRQAARVAATSPKIAVFESRDAAIDWLAA